MSSRAVIQLEKVGFTVIPDILDEDEVREIARHLGRLGTANAGTRRLLNEPWCRGLGQRLARDIRLSKVFGEWRVWSEQSGRSRPLTKAVLGRIEIPAA